MDDEQEAQRAADRTGERAQHMRELDKARRSRVVKIISALVLLVLFVIFVIRNSSRVPVDFVFVEREARLIWVFLVCGLIGGLIGYLLGRPSKAQRHIIREAQEQRPRGER